MNKKNKKKKTKKKSYEKMDILEDSLCCDLNNS